MEAARRRLNNHAARAVIRANGFYIKHPDLRDLSEGLYAEDGVHLSFIGNCIFLTQLSSGIAAFRSGNGTWFE